MKTNTNKIQKSGLLIRPEQSGTRIDFEKRRANRSLNTDALLSVLHRDAPRFFKRAEVVGKWVWIQFDRKQPGKVTAVLSQLGFHWNRTRQTWQHPCGLFRDGSTRKDPRAKYGSYFANQGSTSHE